MAMHWLMQVTEVAAWGSAVQAARDRLAPLSSEEVAETTLAWLQGLSKSCGPHVQQLLQQCSEARMLVSLEQRFLAQQAAWTRAMPMATRRSSRYERGAVCEPGFGHLGLS